MRKFKLLFIVAMHSIRLFSQSSTDAESIFKMYLFLNRPNISNYDENCISKNDSLYYRFSNVFRLEMDTLAINNYLSNKAFCPKIQYYGIKLGFGEASSLRYNDTVSSKDLSCFELPFGFHREFVIAIDSVTGQSYRLQGFDTNDFTFFLSHFQKVYKENSGRRLKFRLFIKKYHVTGLDFKCLYGFNRKNNPTSNKYPCMKRVNEPIGIN
jgi:hypothetical protein